MHKRIGARAILAFVVMAQFVIFPLVSVQAASANISHAYHSTGQISNGSLVSLDSRHSNYVQPANTDNGGFLLGVAVASNQSLLAVDEAPGLVQVATSGSVNTLVSTLNGNIKVGDLISVSPFGGLGMRASPGIQVIGVAQTAFNAHSPGATIRSVTNKHGQKEKLSVGYISINIAINTDTTNTSGINGLQKFVERLTGRVVPTLHIVISLVVAGVALFVLAILVYSSIYGSILAIGRNPLAKNSIIHTLGIVLGMAILTLLISGAIIVFLLY